jgi:hypothetical protein
MKPHIQEAEWSPSKRNIRKTTAKHMTIKALKANDKKKIIEASNYIKKTKNKQLLIRNNAILKTVQFYL